MSWQAYSNTRPSSRSPPPSSTQSRPLSRFSSSSPSPYYQDERERDGAVLEKVPVASLSQQQRGGMNQETRRRTSGSGEAAQDSTQKDNRDPATKQVDQIVQHFFSKTVAVISQTRTTQIPNPDFADLPLNSPTLGAAPSLRRGVSTTGSNSGGKRKGEKMNSWFNLTLPENEHFRTELKTWRNISSLLSSPSPSSTSSSFLSSQSQPSTIPSLVLSVYLDVSDLTPNQVLVLSDQKGRRTRVDRNLANSSNLNRARSPPVSSIPRSRSRGGAGTSTPGGGGGGGSNSSSPTSVVLEQWNLSFQPTPTPRSHPTSSSSSTSDLGKPQSSNSNSNSLPSVYKHSILHFRSLFTLVKLLPTYSLARRLNRTSSTSSTSTSRGGGGVKTTMNGGLRIGIRVEVREPGDEPAESVEGEVEVDTPIENEETGRATETVRFPGVETPLGILHLTGTYRLNTDFGVEDIETLLSSRFIDEDFFRPTVNTARYREKEDSGRPGSLPISARAGLAATQTRLGTSPSHQSPPITGLGPLPSYGSLSSRHQYAPQATTSSVTRPSVPPLPAPVPVHPSTVTTNDSPEPRESLESDRSPSVSSSARLSAYGTSVPSRPGGVEPAFISLSRARSGTNITGIQRVSPSPSLHSGTSGIIRRSSLSGGVTGGHSSSPSSGSPIFRPGSYLSNPSGGGVTGFPSSGSPSFGPPTRQQSTFPPNATTGSQITFGNRISPLSPPTIPSGPSNLGATAPSRPIPLPSSSSPIPGGIPIRGYSYSSTGGGAGVGSGSWSRSYGRGSSGGESGGIEAPAFTRRTSSRLSFGAGNGNSSSSIPRSATTTGTGSSREEEKRFINEGKPPQDAGDINDFLKLLDEKPDLGGLGSSRLGGGGDSGIAGSTVLRKKDVDEQLKMLRSSVLGFGIGGGGGSSPSPPMPAFAISTASGTSSPRGGYGGISNLRRQTSRLSIEEEPADYSPPKVPATMTTTSNERRSSNEGEESYDNGLTPRQPYRQLRPDVVSPPLSTTSATSTVRQQQPLRSESPMRIGLEARLYPLPNSSATSPLASPATLPPFSSVYPPLPYPPSKAKASTSTSTRTEPISFSPYISRAARLAQQERESGGSGGGSERNSAAASVSSFSSAQGDEVDAGSYRGEEEAVGRLELEEEEETVDTRGRRYRGGDVDEEEISLSRDPTPAAAIRLGSGGTASAGVSPYRRTATAAGYFVARSHSRGGVGRRNSP
ncbi:hypothetical protein JCM3765_000523 [Sporobolomyces pararoseus]